MKAKTKAAEKVKSVNEKKSQDVKSAPAAGTLQQIDPEKVKPCRFQNRKDFDAAKLAELASSLAASGMLNPVTVWQPNGAGKGFELIAGERRIRAAKIAKLKTVPAIVLSCDAREAAELCVTENLQRDDLKPIEEAEGVQTLRGLGLTLEECAEKLGKSRQWVLRREKLATLPAKIRASINVGKNGWGGLSVDALEIVAAAAEGSNRGRDEPLASIVHEIERDDSRVATADCLRQVVRVVLHVLGGGFDAEKCKNCPQHFAATDLICDCLGGKKKSALGYCGDRRCYERLQKEFAAGAVAKHAAANPGAKYYTDGYDPIIGGIQNVYNQFELGQSCKANDKNAYAVYQIKRDADGGLVFEKHWRKKDTMMGNARCEDEEQKLEDKKRQAATKIRRGAIEAISKAAAGWLDAFKFEDDPERALALAMMYGCSPCTSYEDGENRIFECIKKRVMGDKGTEVFSESGALGRFRNSIKEEVHRCFSQAEYGMDGINDAWKCAEFWAEIGGWKNVLEGAKIKAEEVVKKIESDAAEKKNEEAAADDDAPAVRDLVLIVDTDACARVTMHIGRGVGVFHAVCQFEDTKTAQSKFGKCDGKNETDACRQAASLCAEQISTFACMNDMQSDYCKKLFAVARKLTDEFDQLMKAAGGKK